ncbi:ABC transporter substrate-binding protein [Rhizobium wenxiniae]|uniref:ABC transporter substrate-binding protein n=1 Tax=Rhizobium wenxiniae TaxID=1737357 RepID=UPI001C6E5252|nr:ABC transporter substrate-binding protein [Rhizobium wenxiniae]
MKRFGQPEKTSLNSNGINRRSLLQTAATAAFTFPFVSRVNAATLDELVLYGPPAGPSITLTYAVGAGLLRDVAERVRFRIWRTPDEMRAGLTSGTMQAVVMPVTAAANLNTRGFGVKLANVMTNGLLYVISTNAEIRSISDLIGREITVPFPNDTPELVFDAVLAHHGLADKVKVNRSGSPVEAIQLLLSGRIETALVPEPAATAAMIKASSTGKTVHRAIDMQKEWGAVTGLAAIMPQAGLALASAFLRDYPERIAPLHSGLEKATEEVVANPAAAAGHAASALELPWPVIEKSIPFSNLVATPASKARSEIEALLEAIAKANAPMIGGKLPGDGLYL